MSEVRGLEKSGGDNGSLWLTGGNQDPNRVTDRPGLGQTDRHYCFEDKRAFVKLEGDHNEAGKGALSRGSYVDERSELGRGGTDDIYQGTIAAGGDEGEQATDGKEYNLDTQA